MATENPVQIVSRIAGTNVTNKRFVVEAAGGVVNRIATQGQRPDGIVAMISTGKTGTTIPAGDEVPMALMSGTVIAEAGAAIADGAEVMSDNVGRAITFAAAALTYAIGKVVNGSSAGAAGEDVSILLYPRGQSL